MLRVISSLRPGARAQTLIPARGALQFTSAAQEPVFEHLELAPADPILGVTQAFVACKDPTKINLGVGAYRDNDGKPVVLESVRQAEKRIAGIFNMEYIPIAGDREFCELSVDLAYGSDCAPLKEGRVAMLQSMSGTGSLRLFGDFMSRYMPGVKIYLPEPTWTNHHNVFGAAGVGVETYAYYHAEAKGVDFEGMCRALNSAPRGSAVLLHACAHNPTGADPSAEQWRELSALFRRRRLFPLFDMAYQGFASGDCDRDAYAVRLFAAEGHRLATSQSYAKNMGLYGQRIGCLSVVCADGDEAARAESQLKRIARAAYSSPPIHGALLAKQVLGDAGLRALWLREVRGMAERIADMRALLATQLTKEGSKLDWSHVTSQIGMFCYTGLTPEQSDRLTREHAIFLTRDGRISMAGVTTNNAAKIAEAIHAVTR